MTRKEKLKMVVPLSHLISNFDIEASQREETAHAIHSETDLF